MRPRGASHRVRGVALPLGTDDEVDTSPLRELVLREVRSAA